LFTIVVAAALFGKIDAWRDWTDATRAWFSSSVASAAVRRLIPAAEAVALVALVVRERLGLALCTALLGVFAAGAAVLAAKGVRSTCACFGTASPSRIGFGLVGRNLAFAVAAGLGAAAAPATRGQSLPAVVTALLLVTLFLLFQERGTLRRVVDAERKRGAIRWIPGIRS
jgi:hypothetical protein